jgi:hypothetical protein
MRAEPPDDSHDDEPGPAASLGSASVDRRARALSFFAVALPFITTCVVFGLLVGPGQARPVRGARLFTAEEAPSTVRLELRERDGLLVRPLGELDLTFQRASEVTTATVGPSGVVEITLATPLEEGERLRITGPGQEVLLDALYQDGDRRSAPIAEGWSFRAGETSVRVRAMDGPLAPPFPSRISIEVTGSAIPPAVTYTAAQAEPAAGRVLLDARGRGELVLTPIASPVDLTLELVTPGGRVERQARLDAPLGAIHAALDASSEEVILTSLSPRDVAFVSLFDGKRRVGGSEVQLSRMEDGLSRGRLALREAFPGALPREGAASPTIVTSSTAEEDAAVSVWFAGSEAPALLVPRADGLPTAHSSEQARVASVRRAMSTFVSIALGVQVLVVLLLARARSRGAGSVPSDGDYAILRKNPLQEPAFVVVVVLVGVMFALWGWLLRP